MIPIPSIGTVDTCELGISIDTATKGLFIWEEIISVTEKTFRQVYKQDLTLL